MKACITLLAFLTLATTGSAAERLGDSALAAKPAVKVYKPSRGLASVQMGADRAMKNEELFDRLKPGDTVIIQNSFPGWEDELAEITEKYDDKSVRIRLTNGKAGNVDFAQLSSTLSPEKADGCGTSHGVAVCKGEKVFYPSRSTSLELPNAPISHVFENGTLTVRDGADFVLDWKQVGKEAECSPQKESLCVGDHVRADAYKHNQPITIDGKIEKTYTHGVVVVRSSKYWRFPIDALAVKKRIEAKDEGRGLASVPAPEAELDDLMKVSPEVESIDLPKADHADEMR